MATSYLHIKTEIECEVYLFDELKGIATPSKWFNLEVRKGEQELLFVSTADNNLRCEMTKQIEETDADYRLVIITDDFCEYSISNVEEKRGMELFKLGCCYFGGRGVQQNRPTAVKYWLESYPVLYNKDNTTNAFHCAWNLGMCYRYGLGVEKNVSSETKWFVAAFANGFWCEDNYKRWGEKNLWEWEFLHRIYQEGTERQPIVDPPLEWDYDYSADKKKIVGDICIYRNRVLFDAAEACGSEDMLKYSILPPYYLFFDTETTGLPDDDDEPASNTDNWPRLVQLAWILTDIEGNVLSSNSKIIKSQGFTIPSSATNVHGITTEKALRDGEPLQQVICSFLEDARVALYFVGHNISFDQNVVGAELNRLGIEDSVSSAPSICTMKETVDFCAINRYWDDEDIPELYGEVMDDEYEYPSLQDLYYKLFEENFEGAHDAMADVTATMKCFFELKRNGLIYDPITDNDDEE